MRFLMIYVSPLIYGEDLFDDVRFSFRAGTDQDARVETPRTAPGASLALASVSDGLRRLEPRVPALRRVGKRRGVIAHSEQALKLEYTLNSAINADGNVRLMTVVKRNLASFPWGRTVLIDPPFLEGSVLTSAFLRAV